MVAVLCDNKPQISSTNCITSSKTLLICKSIGRSAGVGRRAREFPDWISGLGMRTYCIQLVQLVRANVVRWGCMAYWSSLVTQEQQLIWHKTWGGHGYPAAMAPTPLHLYNSDPLMFSENHTNKTERPFKTQIDVGMVVTKILKVCLRSLNQNYGRLHAQASYDSAVLWSVYTHNNVM